MHWLQIRVTEMLMFVSQFYDMTIDLLQLLFQRKEKRILVSFKFDIVERRFF